MKITVINHCHLWDVRQQVCVFTDAETQKKEINSRLPVAKPHFQALELILYAIRKGLLLF